MRPVDRGPVETNAEGEEIKYQEYSHARGELIDRIGPYCSYCEMKLDSSLHVEHIQPKKPPGHANNIVEREFNWGNFLLACANCNSTKGNRDVVLADYYWPDRDNCFRALDYSEGGVVSPAPWLNGGQHQRAIDTIELTGLGKRPGNNPAASDRRWLNRKETWGIATRSFERLIQGGTDEQRDQIVEHAKSQGYWSIWMTVFKDDSDMLNRLIQAFPGTADDCFNGDGEVVVRPAGQV